MVFLLTAIDESGNTRDFSCQLNTLESGFEVLNNVVAMGHTLTKARLLDQGNQTDFPTEAFDGVPFTEALQELEREWKMILREPIDSTATTQTRIDFAHWQLETYETLITSYELFIARLSRLLERAQTMQEVRPGARNFGVIQHYEVALDNYRTRLIKAYFVRHQLLDRLYTLEAQ